MRWTQARLDFASPGAKALSPAAQAYDNRKMNYADLWESLVAPEDRTIAALTKLAQTMRERKATFGDRLHCPFLRPFFLDTADEARVRRVGETLAAIGERVVEASLADPALLAQAMETSSEHS